MTSRDAIASLLRRSDFDSAASLATDLLAKDPSNDDLLGLLALAREGSGDEDGAEDAFKSAVAHACDEAHRIRYASNYAAHLIDRGRRAEARALLDREWIWSPVNGAKPEFVNAAFNLARILQFCDLRDLAIALLRQVSQTPHNNFELLHYFVELLNDGELHEEAYEIVRDAPSELRAHEDFIALKAFVAGKAGHVTEALEAIKTYVERHPVYLTPRPHDGKLGVVVINPLPEVDDLISDRAGHHFSANYPRQLAQRFSTQYVFDSVFAPSDVAGLSQLASDRPRIAVNNVTNAEFLLSDDLYKKIQSIENALGLDVVNRAAHCLKGTRQLNALTFGQLDNVVAPRTERFFKKSGQERQLAQFIEKAFDYPLIVRSIYDNQGQNLHLVRTTQELSDRLKEIPGTAVYVVEFVDGPPGRQHFRRMRAAFVEKEPVIVRADYSAFWMIHGRVPHMLIPDYLYSNELYKDRPDLLEHANQIMRQPERELGKQAITTLKNIAHACPLDIFGLDFDVDEQGRVVFFEANATMNFYINTEPELPYPAEPFSELDEKMHRYFRRMGGLN
jgi:tetratricopeptide (TPR) repeat protein